MVETINSIEFDQKRSEKYVMIKIYDGEVDELREGMKFFESHLKKKQKEKPDPADLHKLRRTTEITRSIDQVWEKINSP